MDLASDKWALCKEIEIMFVLSISVVHYAMNINKASDVQYKIVMQDYLLFT